MSVTSTGQPDTLTLRVAEEIRAVMGRRRVSGAELARRLGVSQMWVSDRLRGVTPINLTDLERIARALEVGARDLFPNPAREVTLPSVCEPRWWTPRSGSPTRRSGTGVRPADTRPAGRPTGFPGPARVDARMAA